MFRLNILRLLLLALTVHYVPAFAVVWVYPGASEDFKSKMYYVRVFHGDEVYESFVYAGKNDNVLENGHLTDYNHWSTFSFSGEVTIEVTKLFGDPVRFCILRPKELRIKPEVSGYVVRFRLDQPAKIYLEMNEAEAEPLFVFADPPETNVPDASDPSVLWFGPGVHKLGMHYRNNSIKEIYLAGGAYVEGSITSNTSKPLRISGRGILSGKGFNRSHTENKLVYLTNNNEISAIEGITLTDAPGTAIHLETPCHVNNVKLFGWSFSSKGIYAGDGVTVTNSFFKVDDDNIIFNGSNILVDQCVFWQQVNGAPFQFSSFSPKSIQNCHIKNIDIIKMDLYEDTLWTSDKTVINCKELGNSVVEDIIFEDIRIEGNAHRLLGINTGTGGVFNNLVIRNMRIEGVIETENYISALKGSVSGILFENVIVNYMALQDIKDAGLVVRGNVSNILFK